MNGAPRSRTEQASILEDPFFGSAIRYALDLLGPVEGRTVVEIGCGDGRLAVFFALRGARAIGCDREGRALSNAANLAREWQVTDQCELIQCDCERMPLGPASADVVCSRSTLQYMDHQRVLAECLRVLKPHGALLIVENLPANPFVRLYRANRRSRAVTPDELAYLESIQGYLTLEEVEGLRTRFITLSRREQHLFRVITAALRYRTNEAAWARILDIPVGWMDDWILTHLAWARRWAWQVVAVGRGKRAGLEG